MTDAARSGRGDGARPGPRNDLADVPGLTVGHAAAEGDATGATVALCARPMIAAVDVRGGGPGTRETDALGPARLQSRVDAIVLSGGSVYGLAAADGVVAALARAGRGLRLAPKAPPTPIAPAAVIYDLSGPDRAMAAPPNYRALGAAAAAAALADEESAPSIGAVGAGLGARAGVLRGGLGMASLDLGDGVMVAALAVANPVGSVRTPCGRAYWAWPFEIDGEFGAGRPDPTAPPPPPVPRDAKRPSLDGAEDPPVNTTICVVASSADLTRDETQRVAIMAQDGVARAVRPAHTPFDGDTVFALSTGETAISGGRAEAVLRLGSATADCLARAIARGVHAAQSAALISETAS